MSAVDEIRAAIEKLTGLKESSTQGVWTILDGGDRFIAEEDPLGDGPFEYIVTEPVAFRREADCDLIEVLHRTIDAQIGVLRDALSLYEDPIPMFIGREDQVCWHQIALARAINGADQTVTP